MNDLGGLIKQRRKALKLSQSGLARHLQVNKSAVAQWELNATRPTEEHMAVLKRVLNITTGPQTSAGSPYRGKLVDDPDLLAWLDFLESIPSAERLILARYIIGDLVMPAPMTKQA